MIKIESADMGDKTVFLRLGHIIIMNQELISATRHGACINTVYHEFQPN